ncbi:MAG: aminotransferase class IV [Sedimentisphaerales bacterium]|nr:aminotransferase class IV [Sedimentisphaerales bacterium]
MPLAMVGDKFIASEKLDPAYLDYGTFFGDGVYEVLRSYDGKLFGLAEHLARFERSLKEIDIQGIDINTVRQRVLKAFEKFNKPDAKIYFHITRGAGPRDHAAQNLSPRFFLLISECEDFDKQKQKGISVITVPDTRWKRCDIKSLNLLPNVLAKRQAQKRGCGEAVFVDDSGFITEGASSAFFAIFGNVLKTAPLNINILPSITRQFVLDIYANTGLELKEERIKAETAASADELFIAVSSRDIVPVVKFNEIEISTGQPGKFTKLLIKEFAKLAQNK